MIAAACSQSNSMLFLIIPFLFAAIHVLEMSGIVARLAGIHAQQPLTAYSIQNAMFMGTRFLFMLLLPLLGFMTDIRIDKKAYLLVAHSSIALAGIASAVVYMIRARVVDRYVLTIFSYSAGTSFISALLRPRRSGHREAVPFITLSERDSLSREMIMKSSAVYCLYSVGVFCAFYFSVLLPEYRASLSQMSGLINATGAVILTFFVEPRIARSIDIQSPDAVTLVNSLLIGRLLAVNVFSQLVLMALWSLT